MLNGGVWKRLGIKVLVLSGMLSGIAPAQELDSLFPSTVPGYGSTFGVASSGRAAPRAPFGVQWGGMSLAPALNLDTGYDSAPNGGNGSVLLGVTPNVTLRDDAAGFGAYGAAGRTSYPEDTARNVNNFSLGLGERATLPRETLTVSGGVAGGQQSQFTLNNIAVLKSIAYTVQTLRLRDDIGAAMFRFTPEISLTTLRLAGFAPQDHADRSAGLTTFYQPGGPVRYVMRVQALQSRYRNPLLSATTQQIAGGFEDTQDGLWTVRALAGLARRRPGRGAVVTVPMLEWRVDWLPTGLDQVRAALTHELDNPDEVSAAPDILTEARVALTHEFSPALTMTLVVSVSDARFVASPDRETLSSTEIGLRWQVDDWVALNGSYGFNDRQANFAAAANEHVVLAGIAWTP